MPENGLLGQVLYKCLNIIIVIIIIVVVVVIIVVVRVQTFRNFIVLLPPGSAFDYNSPNHSDDPDHQNLK